MWFIGVEPASDSLSHATTAIIYAWQLAECSSLCATDGRTVVFSTLWSASDVRSMARCALSSGVGTGDHEQLWARDHFA